MGKEEQTRTKREVAALLVLHSPPGSAGAPLPGAPPRMGWLQPGGPGARLLQRGTWTAPVSHQQANLCDEIALTVAALVLIFS